MDLVAAISKRQAKSDIPHLLPGDRVKVHTRIVEGDRERIQVFNGTVMRLRKGRGPNANFTVRRIASHGIGVERTFLLQSPRIEKIEVAGHTHVRRAQLYYLRGRHGKAARLREKRIVEAAPEAAEVKAD
ncbi:50S ribosomal protein L19 [Anaerolineales bacterium]|nr:50S ribosomal protein L19 [Anaerolineales bacterium]